MSSSRWKTLKTNDTSIPKLLIKSRFDASGYSIHLTDLSCIWREEISKDDIIQRTSDGGSSIDPGEDDEQYNIFLSKIESALNNEQGTPLNITADGNDDLILGLKAPLPHPLPPLLWSITLHSLSPEHLRTHLIQPLLTSSLLLRHQITSLIAELHDKDRIISKICDRLETSGNDLTTVFPGVSNVRISKKKGQREQLARHVRGLAEFDEEGWRRQEVDAEAGGEGWEEEELEGVFRDLREPKGAGGERGGGGRWWERLRVMGASQSRSDEVSQRRSESDARMEQGFANGMSQLKDEESMDVDVDEFQRQGTPPHLRGHKAADDRSTRHETLDPNATTDEEVDAAPIKDDESSTDEEDDDLDAVALRKRTSSQNKPQSPVPPPKPPATSTASPKKLGTFGGRSPAPAREATPEDRPVEARPKSKLGTFGGKRNLPAEAPSIFEPEPAPTSPPAPTKTSRLGSFGGKAKSSTSTSTPPVEKTSTPELAAAEERSPRPPVREETPQPCETSQERADRKRDQLKRELEEKGRGGGKKKRKF